MRRIRRAVAVPGPSGLILLSAGAALFMLYWRRATTVAATIVCAYTLGAAQAQSAPIFQGLGDGTLSAVSRNGQFVLMKRTNGAIDRWSAATGPVSMGFSIGTFDLAKNVSNDGAVVAGSKGATAFRWTSATGLVSLGDLAGGSTYSSAWGMSADGSVIVGESSSTASAATGAFSEAFRWTASTGMVGLGDFAGGNFSSRAESVSPDGSVIVGLGESGPSQIQAFRWTQATGLVGLGDLPGGIFNSQAHYLSADGQVIVGHSFIAGDHEQFFRWTAATGMVGLPFPTDSPQTFAYSTSADGSVIVGTAYFYTPSFNTKALIWDAAHGTRLLQDALASDYGLNLTGWTLRAAGWISDDGRTIAGVGVNPAGKTEGWVAIVPEPSGLVLFALGAGVLLILHGSRRALGARRETP